MLRHRAFGRHLDTLTVAVVDNRRPILSLMRAMLAAIGTGRIDIYASPTEALDAMAKTAPDIVIAGASMQPISGPALVMSLRRAESGPLSLVPAMIMSVHATPALIEAALKAGAHQVLVLPATASTLYRRLDWLIHDDRPFELRGEHYVVAGMEERLSISFPRPVCAPSDPSLPPASAATGR
jgi:DNA-binding NarL/FixJ family response regulator